MTYMDIQDVHDNVES